MGAFSSLLAGDVFRARLMLALTDGITYRAIKQTLHKTAPKISRWTHRFQEAGLDGLDAQHKGNRPRIAR